MEKLIISGSSKLHQRALYWVGYFEGRGYEVIDYPTPITNDSNDNEVTPAPGYVPAKLLSPEDPGYSDHLLNTYKRYWRNLDQADAFFLMNEDRDGITGKIGYGAMAELEHVLINNFNQDKQVKIFLLQEPSSDQEYYSEIKFWLDQGLIQIHDAPESKTELLPVPQPETSEAEIPVEAKPKVVPALSAKLDHNIATPKPRSRFFHSDGKTINLLTSRKKCLRVLPLSVRQYLQILTPNFPAWLLKYIAAPEMQRLVDVSMVSMDYSSMFNFQSFNSVLAHSIGVALIIWNFTHDKKQTLAGLFHDIASPSFKHAVDYLNGDSERQESLEADTAQIIRNSRVIMRQLKKDNILPSEVEDYHLYPIADNDVPGLAADRLEYTLSNGYFLYETWGLNDVKRFYEDLTILTNEEDQDELGFRTLSLAAEFTQRNLPLAANYHSEKARATYQFIADILKMMVDRELLTVDDLYVMSEREVIDWILSCGDRTISEAFRNFQRATSAYSGNVIKKNCYCTDVKAKVRYIVPLVESKASDSDSTSDSDDDPEKLPVTNSARVIDLDSDTANAITDYLRKKQPKYVGLDFEFKPSTK